MVSLILYSLEKRLIAKAMTEGMHTLLSGWYWNRLHSGTYSLVVSSMRCPATNSLSGLDQ